jgi:hypothetical protein
VVAERVEVALPHKTKGSHKRKFTTECTNHDIVHLESLVLVGRNATTESKICGSVGIGKHRKIHAFVDEVVDMSRATRP